MSFAQADLLPFARIDRNMDARRGTNPQGKTNIERLSETDLRDGRRSKIADNDTHRPVGKMGLVHDPVGGLDGTHRPTGKIARRVRVLGFAMVVIEAGPQGKIARWGSQGWFAHRDLQGQLAS